MGERGATGGAWGARDDASWWPGSSGELQHEPQLNEEIGTSTAASTHQLYTYKMASGFSNNGGDITTPSYDYRLMSNSNTREESPQQQWWYASGSVESQQTSSPTSQNQSSPDREQNNQQANGIQQNHQTLQQQEQNQIQQQNQLQQQLQQQSLQQALQQQNLQQALQQQNQSLQQTLQQQQQEDQQQTLQQMLQQHQQQQQQQQQQQKQQVLQQSLQQTLQVSQAQAQAIVQAQAALQQQVAQSLQQQQQTLHDHIQAVQQQQIQAALQRQSATLQELQQQAQQQALVQTTVSKGRMPRARPYNKPRGRMTAYAFFVQTCREEHKKKHPDENVIFAAFSKKCAERWNTMSEKEKQRFHEMAEQDKQRFDLEMQNYVPPKDVKIRGRKRQQVKDPNAPKRSLSAFFIFCNHERPKVKVINPEYTMGDVAKELGRRWAAADPDTKAKYDALSEQDKARYDREMTAYKKGPLALAQQPPQQPQPIPIEVEDEGGEFDGDEEYN